MVHNLSQNCQNDEQDTNLKELGPLLRAIATSNAHLSRSEDSHNPDKIAHFDTDKKHFVSCR